MDVVELESAGIAHVDRARQRLSEISFASTLKACLYLLRKNPNDGFDWYARRPFIIFLMIKWAAEFWRVDDDRRPGQDEDFDSIDEEIFQSTPHLVQVVTWSIFRRRMEAVNREDSHVKESDRYWLAMLDQPNTRINVGLSSL